MKFKPLVSAFALVALGATAWPELTNSDREKVTSQFLDRGLKALSRVSITDKNAAKVNKLDRAIYSLRRAHVEVQKCKGERCADLREDVDESLVRALDDQADVYIERRSLPLAKKRVVEALTVIPYEPRSEMLLERIKSDEANSGTWFGGVPATRRILERRAADGVTTPAGAERFVERR